MTDEKKQSEMTALFRKHGAFFAFNEKQLNDKAQAGIKYVSMGAGLICPKENAAQLHKEFAALCKAHANADKQAYTKTELIEYALNNHECYYTGDISDAVAAVAEYEYTFQDVLRVYNDTKHKYNY